MKKYRKKPVVIEAIQLTEKNIKEVYELVYNIQLKFNNKISLEKWEDYESKVKEKGLIIPTLEDGKNNEAKHIASIGDYVIKGIKGEFYPCKPDIFNLTYEIV